MGWLNDQGNMRSGYKLLAKAIDYASQMLREIDIRHIGEVCIVLGILALDLLLVRGI
jgi:hypothetical protein